MKYDDYEYKHDVQTRLTDLSSKIRTFSSHVRVGGGSHLSEQEEKFVNEMLDSLVEWNQRIQDRKASMMDINDSEKTL